MAILRLELLTILFTVGVIYNSNIIAGSYAFQKKLSVDLDVSEDKAKCNFGKETWANLMGGCYLITENNVDWKGASDACKKLDSAADFGTLWTGVDLEFVTRLARRHKIHTLFVNGKYVPSLKEFRWKYNRPLVENQTPWAKDEPKVNEAGQVLVLQVPDEKTGSLASVSEMSEGHQVLCKRPAKGFRRRTVEQIGSYTSHLSKGPHGGELVVGEKAASTERGNDGKEPARKDAAHDRYSKKYKVFRDKSKKHTQGGHESEPDYEDYIEENEGKHGNRVTEVGSKRFSHWKQSNHLRLRHDKKSDQRVIKTQSKPELKTMPPPISKDREFLTESEVFKPIMPVLSKGSKRDKNLEISAIEPVDVVDLVKAREDKLTELFGRSELQLEDAMEYYPRDYRYPSTDYERMAHVLTTELIAQDERQRSVHTPLEGARILTMQLFLEGKSIQCYFGDSKELIGNRQVECIATAGTIKLCVKETLLSGKVIRGCGLPGFQRGTEHSGCSAVSNGEICYCKSDYCNSGHALYSSCLHLVLICTMFVFFKIT